MRGGRTTDKTCKCLSKHTASARIVVFCIWQPECVSSSQLFAALYRWQWRLYLFPLYKYNPFMRTDQSNCDRLYWHYCLFMYQRWGPDSLSILEITAVGGLFCWFPARNGKLDRERWSWGLLTHQHSVDEGQTRLVKVKVFSVVESLR